MRPGTLTLLAALLVGCGAQEDPDRRSQFQVSIRYVEGFWVASTPACDGITARARQQHIALKRLTARARVCIR